MRPYPESKTMIVGDIKAQADSRSAERGATLLLVSFLIASLLGMAALVVDLGYLFWVRNELQATADAAALAGAQEIPDSAETIAVASEYATTNESGDTSTLKDSDVVLGNWDFGSRDFAPNGNPTNAVQVTVRRSQVNGNPVQLWFARVIGIQDADVDATAIAVAAGSGGSRFLIDAEMIDSDIPVIEDLAESLGEKPEDIISDMNGDWFIDLPPGVVLELPTGQVGDEGLFDITRPEFPFQPTSDPSLVDFLNFNEDGSWREYIFPKSMLDPLVGVTRVDDPAMYPTYVGGGCQVSPVYKSDSGAINPVDGVPAVNALGQRRGLLAFKILSVGADPDGNGSGLPNLVIEVCAPMPLDDLVVGEGGSGVRLVR